MAFTITMIVIVVIIATVANDLDPNSFTNDLGDILGIEREN